MGDRPQAIINEQLVADCDILVAIFGTRLGAPTGEAPSGTVEEIQEHLDAGKRAMLYFSSQTIRLDSLDEEQYAALKEFKAACLKRGLVESYESVDAFREKFYRQFSQTMNRIPHVPTDIQSESDDQFRVGPDLQLLSDAAATLLLEATTDNQGTFIRTDYAEGTELLVNGKQLIESQDARSIARWNEVIRELEDRGLIRDTWCLDSAVKEFAVTDAGFKFADSLREGVELECRRFGRSEQLVSVQFIERIDINSFPLGRALRRRFSATTPPTTTVDTTQKWGDPTCWAYD